MLKLIKYFKPFIKSIALIVLLMLCQAVAELFLPTLMSDVVNKGMLTGNKSEIIAYAIPMMCAALVSVAGAVSGSYYSSLVAVGISRDLRSAVFARIESFSLNEFDKFGAASLITRATNDVVQVQMSLIMIFRFMVYAPLMCAGGLFMAISRDKGLALVLAVSIPLIIVLMAFVGRKALPLFRAMQKKIDRVNMVAREGLTGVRVIRAFNREQYERNRFDAANSDLMRNAIVVNRLMALLLPTMLLIMSLTSVAILWFGSRGIAAGTTDLGGMMAFLQYSMMIMFSFVMVSMLFIMLPRASASAERINEVLETKGTVGDPVNPLTPPKATGVLEFRNVSFRYKGAERPALNNISFKAEPGKTTAIIGGTGSGKSTLVGLIPRFYDATSGEVLIDGLGVTEMTQSELRSKIGFVPQKAVLFSDTVAGNIRYGNETATDEEVAAAAETAQAANFINKLEGGYDYMISQGGTNVSGGQRQRLSIARALVRKPLIYVFDDSFSSLDMKTDANLRAALKKETKDSVVIIVAQRISSIIDADTIIVLDSGEIAGMGTHKELLESCGIYKEIAASQS